MKTSLLKSLGVIGTFLLVGVAVGLLLDGCKGNEIYPEVPEITFKTAILTTEEIPGGAGFDTIVLLTFGYKDGDGDIGFNADDTFPPRNYVPTGINGANTNRYYNNIFIDYFEKINGKYYEQVLPNGGDTIFRDVRIGNLTPDGKHKAIRGEIQVSVLISTYPDRADTIKLKARLVDRAMHFSNEIETPEIFLNKR